MMPEENLDFEPDVRADANMKEFTPRAVILGILFRLERLRYISLCVRV